MYFYLKLSEPCPKGQDGWNFEYKDIEYNALLSKIHEIIHTYSILNIEYKILTSDEISDY